MNQKFTPKQLQVNHKHDAKRSNIDAISLNVCKWQGQGSPHMPKMWKGNQKQETIEIKRKEPGRNDQSLQGICDFFQPATKWPRRLVAF